MENHPSLINIKKGFDTSFTFIETNSNKVIQLTKTLDISKAYQNIDIPIKIINLNADLFATYIFRNFNYCLKKGEFPFVLKHVDVLPVH